MIKVPHSDGEQIFRPTASSRYVFYSTLTRFVPSLMMDPQQFDGAVRMEILLNKIIDDAIVSHGFVEVQVPFK